mmetsp:Transcript_32074/g.99071  ORF Transcript_32074/g.99071 Transcript_32074/m.99071 type:complete len:252 (+) Transcript_32074:152-907(+)
MAYGTFSSRAASKKSGRSGLVALVLAAAAGGLVYVSSPGLAKTATELVIGPQYTWDSDFPKPNGTESVGTSTIAVYTPAQQEQYGINKFGESTTSPPTPAHSEIDTLVNEGSATLTGNDNLHPSRSDLMFSAPAAPVDPVDPVAGVPGDNPTGTVSPPAVAATPAKPAAPANVVDLGSFTNHGGGLMIGGDGGATIGAMTPEERAAAETQKVAMQQQIAESKNTLADSKNTLAASQSMLADMFHAWGAPLP